MPLLWGHPANDPRSPILRKSAPIAALTAALIALGLAHPQIALPGQTISPVTKAGKVKCKHVTAAAFQDFSEQVWRLPAWERGEPPRAIIRVQRGKLRCARGPGHRKAMKDRWRKDKRLFYEYRQRQLFRVRVTPFYGGGRWWALPYAIVVCESGGRYNDPSAPNGAYSLLTGPLQGIPTWETWRPSWASRFAAPYEAPKKAQDIAAHRLYMAYGSEPWAECA